MLNVRVKNNKRIGRGTSRLFPRENCPQGCDLVVRQYNNNKVEGEAEHHTTANKSKTAVTPEDEAKTHSRFPILVRGRKAAGIGEIVEKHSPLRDRYLKS